MNIKYKILSLGLLLVILILSVSNVMAWPKDYVLELTIITDKQEEFVSIIELDDRQFRDLKNDTNFEIKPYLVQARKDYADEIGYRKEIYGEDNYKMVNIVKYSFVVRDKSSGRVLLKK
jgi:hypothetical protein